MAVATTSNVTRPVALGYGARLGELYLRLAVGPERPLDIRTAELAAPQVNTSSQAEEFRTEYGELFSRSEFSGGEGLDYAHKRNLQPIDSTRFWDSKHIDITNPTPGEPAKITLAPPTLNIETSASTNVFLAFDGTALSMGEGNALRRSTTHTATSPSFADDDPGAGAALLDVTTLGSDTYTVHSGATMRKKTSGVWSALASSSTSTTRAWGVKRQILTAGTTVLQTIDMSTGADGTVLVTLATGQTWLDVVEAGAAVLAAASDGNIYLLGNSDLGVLELKAQTQVGPTEVPYCLGFNGSQVFYETREATPSGAIARLYRTDLDQTGFRLGNAQLLRQWGDQSASHDFTGRKITATRDAMLFGIYEDDGSWVWRYDNATGALSRYLDLGASGTVVDLLAVGGRVFASVAGHGLRREQVGSFESSGWLMGPLGDFFTASQKSWAGALLEHESLPAGSRLELYYTTDPTALQDPDGPGWVRAKNITVGTDAAETPLVGVESRYLAGMVRLYADTTTTTSPEVRSFTFRAYPGEGDVIVDLPVVISDEINRPNRRRIVTKGGGARIYAELKGLEGAYNELELFRPEELLRGVVEQVGTRVQAITERGTVTDTAIVRFRGRRVSITASASTSTAVLGVGRFAEMFFAGREIE